MLNRKKTIISGVMAAMLAMGIASPAFAAETANPTSSTIYVDGQDIAFEAYNINGNNYFKLRDVAWALSGTSKQFNVEWNDEEKVINLVSGKEYGKNGKLTTGDGVIKSATVNSAPIMVDGEYVDMMAYNINGNNFFKLRDLGETFDFAVGWNGDANAVSISTTGEIEEVEQPKEEQKQEVTTDGVRWDLISTEWHQKEIRPGEEYGLPEYMIVGLYPNPYYDNGEVQAKAYDTRTGTDYLISYSNPNNKAGIPKIIEKVTSIKVQNQTFKEGELHSYPRIGDTIIKKDGSKIILKGTLFSTSANGVMVMGYGQSVDIWTGLQLGKHIMEGERDSEGYYYTSADGSFYYKCPTTGEMHSEQEWGYILEVTNPNGKYVGDYDGEIYEHLWKWDADGRLPGTNIIGYWKWIGP